MEKMVSEIFQILNKNGENEDGFIFKEWEGFREWVNMDHENFIIQCERFVSFSFKQNYCLHVK